MKRVMSLLVLLGVLGLVGPAAAEMCPKCADGMYMMSIGECEVCGGATSSGAHKICKACSDKRGECEHCRAKLKAGAPAKPAGLAPAGAIDPHESKEYTHGQWKYAYDVRSLGSRSERRSGVLTFDGKTVAEPKDDESRLLWTPWGPMQHFGGRYQTGWLPLGTYDRPLAIGEGAFQPNPDKELKASQEAFVKRLRSLRDNPQWTALWVATHVKDQKMSPGMVLIAPRHPYTMSLALPEGTATIALKDKTLDAVVDWIAGSGLLAHAVDDPEGAEPTPEQGVVFILNVIGDNGKSQALQLVRPLPLNLTAYGQLRGLTNALGDDAKTARPIIDLIVKALPQRPSW